MSMVLHDEHVAIVPFRADVLYEHQALSVVEPADGLGVVHTIYEETLSEDLSVCRETSSDDCCSVDLMGENYQSNVFDLEGEEEIRVSSASSSTKSVIIQANSYDSSSVSCTLQRSILAWYDATGLPATVSVYVEGREFKLHKFPLVSLSGFLKRELMESNEIHLPSNWPGGATSFEVAASFCYGSGISLGASNVAAVRCAAELLEMTEEYNRGNLCRRCDQYLRQFVLRRWTDTITVLKQCQALRPLADELLIVGECVEAIATMACGQAANIVEIHDSELGSLLGGEDYAMEDMSRLKASPTTTNMDELDRIDQQQYAWIGDLVELPWHQFAQVVGAVRRLGMREKHIGKAMVRYVEKWVFPCFDDQGRQAGCMIRGCCSQMRGAKRADEAMASMCANLEEIVRLLPHVEGDGQANIIPVDFLFGLLKCAVLGCADMECKMQIQLKIAGQLHLANARDLALLCSPSANCEEELEAMRQIVDVFFSAKNRGDASPHAEAVTNLWDQFLAGLATCPKLTARKFAELIEVIPPPSRPNHDRLYRAINAYLQAHPELTQEERLRVCKWLNCQKLSRECCVHAVHNEGMPLRTIVQAMFMHHLHVSSAVGRAPSTSPSLQRSASCSAGPHHPHANACPAETWPDACRTATGPGPIELALPAGSAGAATRQLADVNAIRDRLETLEEEIGRLKRGLAEMQGSSTNGGDASTWRDRTGWRHRWAFLRRGRRGHDQQHACQTFLVGKAPSCCIRHVVASPANPHHHDH